jgi:hypothetical protein
MTLESCIRTANELLEDALPKRLGERFHAQQYDPHTNLVLWVMGEGEVENPEDFFVAGAAVDYGEVTEPQEKLDILHKYRRASSHVFASRLLALLLQREQPCLQLSQDVTCEFKRSGVVEVEVELPRNVCPRIKHAPTGDAQMDSVVTPIFSKAKWSEERETVLFRHCFVVVEFAWEGSTAPYVYVDLCPMRLGVSVYDTDTISMPLLVFKACDEVSDCNFNHILALTQHKTLQRPPPLVYWCDDAETWQKLNEDENSPFLADALTPEHCLRVLEEIAEKSH